MKKGLFLFSVMLALVSCAANRGKTANVFVTDEVTVVGTENVSVVYGVWQRGNPEEVKLYEVDRGRLRKIASSVPDAAGRFFFAFQPVRAAFYVIGVNDAAATNNYTFRFKPGDRLSLTVNGEGYTLGVDNTPENVEMKRWHDWIQPLEKDALYSLNSTFDKFFPLMDKMLAEGYTPVYTYDAAFNAAFDHYRKSYMATVAGNFLLTPRPKHPKADDLTDYYRNLDISDLATSELLDYPYGISLLRQYPMIYMTANRDGSGGGLRGQSAIVDFVISRLRDDKLTGEYVLDNAANIKTYEGYLAFGEKYSRYFMTDDQKERFKSMLKYIPVPKGYPAIDFRFPDTKGNEVALSDFKGKVVYIDVWATWCGPCKAQVPHLKKLESEYRDNPDVVFMSISTDADKDRRKWLDMVAEEELVGVQLFGGDRSRTDLSEPYKISSIPRFILVGKDGNIINDNAPRPSSPDIRPMLNAAIAR